jgi:hypothetical protein
VARFHHKQMRDLLAAMIRRDPAHFARTFGRPGGGAMLRGVWGNFGGRLPVDARVAPAGLDVARVARGGEDALVITFPPAEAGEVIELVVLLRSPPLVFALERAVQSVAGQDTVIAELRAEGRAFFGAGPTTGDTLDAVLALVAADATPLAMAAGDTRWSRLGGDQSDAGSDEG